MSSFSSLHSHDTTFGEFCSALNFFVIPTVSLLLYTALTGQPRATVADPGREMMHDGMTARKYARLTCQLKCGILVLARRYH